MGAFGADNAKKPPAQLVAFYRQLLNSKEKPVLKNQNRFTGADYEARTRYLHLGKVALYQMS